MLNFVLFIVVLFFQRTWLLTRRKRESVFLLTLTQKVRTCKDLFERGQHVGPTSRLKLLDATRWACFKHVQTEVKTPSNIIQHYPTSFNTIQHLLMCNTIQHHSTPSNIIHHHPPFQHHQTLSNIIHHYPTSSTIIQHLTPSSIIIHHP